MEKYEYYDIHTHFLPGMDLGCKDIKDAMQMVRRMVEQGCMGVIATPHFYSNETIESFLNRREESFMKLTEEIKGSDISGFEKAICLGAEVGYHKSLIFEPQLKKLCLGRSDYILLELPFAKWGPEVLENVQKMMQVREVDIIIAHLERFFEYGNKKYINELLKMNVMIQMNTEHLLKFGAFRHALDMIKNKRVDILSTDCHGTFFYPPNMEQALAKMVKADLQTDIERMLENSYLVYNGSMRAAQRI